MYWTQSFPWSPGGRYDMRMYLPSDGPMPAEVTYDRRPFASTSGDPLARRDVRRFADEVLVLHLPPRHVGLDDVVVLVELRAECAVRLLEPAGRPVYANARGDDAVRAA